MTAKERWSHWHWTTRLSVVFGLIAAVWVGVTAAIGTTERHFWTRREQERYADSVAVSAVLHGVRDSARQERIWRAIKYEGCMRRTRNDYRACELFNDKAP